DIFVILVAGRAGAKIEDIQYTAFEFDCAIRELKPIIALMISDARFEDLYSKGVDTNSELLEFRKKIKNAGRIIEFFDNEAELPAKYNLALHKQVLSLRNNVNAGLISAAAYSKFRQLGRITNIPAEFVANDICFEMISNLSRYEIAVSRLNKDRPEKEYMGELLWRLLATPLFHDAELNRIFFDGTTSVLFLSREYRRYVIQRTHALKKAKPPSFYTNSIWIFLDLFFM